MFNNSIKPKTNLLSGELSFNCIKNLYARDLGIISTTSFIAYSNTRRLDEIRLSKYRSVTSLKQSVTWLNLDSVDSRFLLAAKSDGNFTCMDMFEKKIEHDRIEVLKPIFDSTLFPRKNAHDFCCSCIQWYPIDSGMFFTSGMDEKFKVWDTNALEMVDEYRLKHKIYSHNISMVASCNAKSLVALALDNGQVRFIDLNSGAYTHTLKAHPQGYCVCVQWSPSDPNVLASGGSDGRIALWDIRSSKSCLFCLDFEKTVSSSKKTKSGSFSKALAHNGPIVGLTYTPDGHNIVSLGKDNRLQLWNADNGLNTITNYGKVPLNLAVAEASLQMSCTEFCLERYIYVPSNNNMLMYNIHEGTLKSTYKGHFEAVNCCYYNPSLNEVYTGSKDRNILIWTPEKQASFFENSVSKQPEKSAYSILSGSGRTSNSVTAAIKRPRDNWSDDDD